MELLEKFVERRVALGKRSGDCIL